MSEFNLSGIPAAAFKILGVLNVSEKSELSLQEIVDRSGLCIRTCRDYLRWLKENEFVRAKTSGGNKKFYSLK